ncbi:lipase family protein [Rhodococcus chondri]|uniref:Serine peptidase n=1 Tax=Rhodococcus chondri TaxID=3065941 RepID=A0ABU7JUK9_9NOCA|nr:hypothetical protein [Rhodococcus sp. CC-R104]MEE2033713.1 hypothetical protein [Rhodococcus sp. CC-R104]
MAHITFVHGIANKPAPDELLSQWKSALRADNGVDLDERGVTTSMLYWADMLYPTPIVPGPSPESTVESVEAADPGDADLAWLDEVPADERGFVERLAKDVGMEGTAAQIEADVLVPQTDLELLPLPGWVERRLMRVFLRDVHHYLYDASFSPRAGATFRIRTDIRARARAMLHDAAALPGPHLLVGHSLGSVIAYDALTGIDDIPDVDAFLTLGSPLGIAEVQDGLTPPWTSGNGWPNKCLGDGPWRNVFDPFDPVCGLTDRRIGGDFRRGGRIRVDDIEVANSGTWRHSIDKYLRQQAVREYVRAFIE